MRIRSRRMLWLVGLMLPLLGAVALWTAPRWLVPRLAARSPGCLYAVPTAERVVALTIDDGPSVSTGELLRVMREHGARATFFLIAGNVRGREATAAAIARAGHEIGNHMTRDEPSLRLTPAAFDRDLAEAGRVLARYGPVRWARPGSGRYDAAMLATMARQGYRCALGSVYPYDPHVPSVRVASAYILANVRPGAVIILHDGRTRGPRTAATLRRVLPALARAGYRVVTLSELVELTAAAVTVTAEPAHDEARLDVAADDDATLPSRSVR